MVIVLVEYKNFETGEAEVGHDLGKTSPNFNVTPDPLVSTASLDFYYIFIIF